MKKLTFQHPVEVSSFTSGNLVAAQKAQKIREVIGNGLKKQDCRAKGSPVVVYRYSTYGTFKYCRLVYATVFAWLWECLWQIGVSWQRQDPGVSALLYALCYSCLHNVRTSRQIRRNWRVWVLNAYQKSFLHVPRFKFIVPWRFKPWLYWKFKLFLQISCVCVRQRQELQFSNNFAVRFPVGAFLQLHTTRNILAEVHKVSFVDNLPRRNGLLQYETSANERTEAKRRGGCENVAWRQRWCHGIRKRGHREKCRSKTSRRCRERHNRQRSPASRLWSRHGVNANWPGNWKIKLFCLMCFVVFFPCTKTLFCFHREVLHFYAIPGSYISRSCLVSRALVGYSRLCVFSISEQAFLFILSLVTRGLWRALHRRSRRSTFDPDTREGEACFIETVICVLSTWTMTYGLRRMDRTARQ